jgi:endogenous inhibitor of DNA gyrase (YacG/DUF329 family)
MEGQSARAWPQYPFCSDRCRVVDLGRWLGGSYRIAADNDEEVESKSDTLSESH